MSTSEKTGRNFVSMPADSTGSYYDFVNSMLNKMGERTHFEYVLIAPKNIDMFELESIAAKLRAKGKNASTLQHGNQIGIVLRSEFDFIAF